MARRKLEFENIRALTQRGDSLSVTLPVGIIRKLRWRKSQKVTVILRGESVIVKDWRVGRGRRHLNDRSFSRYYHEK
jgi:antitoxin component of MazEF toxin-antitoxin module